MNKKIQALRGELIVSCQALPEEPLHSSYIMSKMAAAALEGGAKGIRANTKEDIRAIQEEVDLPIIGIVKRDYPDCEVYITPTMKEVDELMEVKPEIIALDATGALRPGGLTDCSTVKEAQYADEIGFDFIGTTMVGYTKQSQGDRIEEEDFRIIREILETVKHPVIAEGNINTPEKAKRVKELGVFSTVVGSVITRPQLITRSFVDALHK